MLGHKFLIQDFYVPTEGLAAFLGNVRRDAGIYPLWLCPIRGTRTPQFLSPHYQETASRWPLPDFVNVGAYGVPHQGRAIPDATRALESLVHQLGGRKMLDSIKYSPEDEFWKVYDRARYLALRREAVSEGCWRDLYDKTHNPTPLKVQA